MPFERARKSPLLTSVLFIFLAVLTTTGCLEWSESESRQTAEGHDREGGNRAIRAPHPLNQVLDAHSIRPPLHNTMPNDERTKIDVFDAIDAPLLVAGLGGLFLYQAKPSEQSVREPQKILEFVAGSISGNDPGRYTNARSLIVQSLRRISENESSAVYLMLDRRLSARAAGIIGMAVDGMEIIQPRLICLRNGEKASYGWLPISPTKLLLASNIFKDFEPDRPELSGRKIEHRQDPVSTGLPFEVHLEGEKLNGMVLLSQPMIRDRIREKMQLNHFVMARCFKMLPQTIAVSMEWGIEKNGDIQGIEGQSCSEEYETTAFIDCFQKIFVGERLEGVEAEGFRRIEVRLTRNNEEG